ncbi:MAG TPA: amidohydrolase family protein [Mycobacteriales bacterium]|nr:amidohydrolase family protein [Mycobacteriales bacterium]
MPIIDAHTHLAGTTFDEEVLRDGARLGVQAFLCSAIAHYRHYPSFAEVAESNAALAQVMAKHPGVVRGYCYVNPRHGAEAMSEFTRCVEEYGMIGLKLWVATTCDDPLVYPFIERAIHYRMPILAHCWEKTVGQLPYETRPVNIARLAARYPEAHIIMAHLGGRVESAVNTVRECPNVLTDTSGTPIGGAEVAIAVQRLGADRVVFGSDLHGACLAANIGKILGANLSIVDQDRVLGGNIARLLEGVRR